MCSPQSCGPYSTRTPMRCQRPQRCTATGLRRLSPRSSGLWEREPGLGTCTTSSLYSGRRDALPKPDLIRSVYEEKCESKGVEVFTSEAIQASPLRKGLEDEWGNMLAHQLPALPPFPALWEELPRLYAWLDGASSPDTLTPIPVGEDVDETWSPPAGVSAWGLRAPLEMLRFAAANHLCVELDYQESRPLGRALQPKEDPLRSTHSLCGGVRYRRGPVLQRRPDSERQRG